MLTRLSPLLVAVATMPAVASAQLPEILPGERIRVDAAPALKHRIAGTLMSRSGDTLTIASSATSWRRVRKSDIRRIDVSRGDSRVLGALKGVAMAGVGPGLLTLVVAAPKGREPENVALSVGIVGAVIGGVVGFVLRTERWNRIYPPRDRQPPPRDPYWTG